MLAQQTQQAMGPFGFWGEGTSDSLGEFGLLFVLFGFLGAFPRMSNSHVFWPNINQACVYSKLTRG